MDTFRYLPITIVFILFTVPSASAKPLHQPPFDYLFGNHIDTHQQTRLKDNGTLFGFLYVIDTGDTDATTGLPVMRHPRGLGDSFNEQCGLSIKCIKAWQLRAQPAAAKFLFHSGVNGNDHPVWLLNRIDIPQPGHYTHFHWISSAATDLRASSVSEACDKTMASQLETQDPVATNQVCVGWFLQLTAMRAFAFEHGGEIIPVYPGDDNSTHINILTNYSNVEGITPTRASGEH